LKFITFESNESGGEVFSSNSHS